MIVRFLSALPGLIPLIQWIPLLVNSLFFVWVVWSYRRHARPPLWPIPCLLIFGIGSIWLLFIAGELCQVYAVFLIAVSAIFCLILALSMICRRWLGMSHPKSWFTAALIILPPVIWADYRFRIVANDLLGRPVEADAKNMKFSRPSVWLSNPPLNTLSGSLFYAYPERFNSREGHGIALKKGVVYFGFCQWVVFRGDLDISAGAGDPDGIRGGVKISNPGWDDWPIPVTPPLVSGH